MYFVQNAVRVCTYIHAHPFPSSVLVRALVRVHLFVGGITQHLLDNNVITLDDWE